MKIRFSKLNQGGFDHLMVAVFVIVFAVVGGTAYVLTHADPGPWNGAFKVNMKNTNLCMENMDNSNTAYTSLLLNTCSASSAAQHFSISMIKGSHTNFQIVAANSKACVDDPAGRVGTNASNRIFLETWPCNSSDTAQIWHWGGTGNHQLINVRSSACINDPSASTDAGTVETRLIAFSCINGGNRGNDQWLKATNTAGNYTSVSGQSSAQSSSSASTEGKVAASKSTFTTSSPAALQSPMTNPAGYHMCVDNRAGKAANNNPVEVWQCNGTAAQSWTYSTLKKTGNQNLKITNNQKYCLAAFENQTADGTPVSIYTCNDSSGQNWKVLFDKNNVEEIVNTPGSGKCLTDPGFSATNGTQLQLGTCKNDADQTWWPVVSSTSSKR